jgi:hypothetical protein
MSKRVISWPGLAELVAMCGEDVSSEPVRAWVATVGAAWAENADDHIDWLLDGKIDVASLSRLASHRIRSNKQGHAYLHELRVSLRAALAHPPPRITSPRRERFTLLVDPVFGSKVLRELLFPGLFVTLQLLPRRFTSAVGQANSARSATLGCDRR